MLRAFKFVLALPLALLVHAPAHGDEAPREYRPHHRWHGIHLPPERHVIEVVQPPWSGRFIINGTRFIGNSPACYTWAAGERITLVAGDWHGRCEQAVFYNLDRRSTCEMSCRRWWWW